MRSSKPRIARRMLIDGERAAVRARNATAWYGARPTEPVAGSAADRVRGAPNQSLRVWGRIDVAALPARPDRLWRDDAARATAVRRPDRVAREPVSLSVALPCLRGVNRYDRADQYCIHHQARGQTLMPCRPQRRQRQIWAYQPAPHSSKPSCAVSSPQSRQKRRKRSGPSRERVALRRATSDPDDQSPSAANKSCKRFRRSLPTGPLRCRIEARPTRSRK